MNRRFAVVLAAGMVAGVVATGVGVVSAQPTQQSVNEKAKGAAKAAQTKWESLPPAYQQKLAADWKMSGAEAKSKWDSLPADQQAELKSKAVATGKATRKKYEELPKQ
jgi:hypothetical protein